MQNNNSDKISKLLSSLNSTEKQELDDIIHDKNKINEILNSPTAKKIIEKFNEEKNGHK